MLTAWHERDDRMLISAFNLSEVLIAPAADQQRLRMARAAIAALGVAIHRPTEALGVDAARLRARHQLSLPDAYRSRLAGASERPPHHSTAGSTAPRKPKTFERHPAGSPIRVSPPTLPRVGMHASALRL